MAEPGVHNPLRIVYAAGPGDVLGTFEHWKAGRDDPSQVAVTYSSQFYDVARDLGAEALVISSNTRAGAGEHGSIRVENVPPKRRRCGAVSFHLGQMLASVRLLRRARTFNADVLVVADGTGHWFPLRLAKRFGIHVIPTLHCVLWAKNRQPSKVHRMLNAMARGLFRRGVAGTLAVSDDIAEQVAELTGGVERPIYTFLPTYRQSQFADIRAHEPRAPGAPFRVLFAGRVERNKGVFDLLDIAKRFDREERGEIEFDLCGNGGALDELRGAVTAAGPAIAARFRCHGHCDRTMMRGMFAAAHVVIVPTTSDFVEGFNKVVAEGVLSQRPVITSSVCPAVNYLRGAVVEVPPDDVKAYGDAILRLCDDQTFYGATVAACRATGEPFFDPGRGWGAALRRALCDARLIQPQQAEPVTMPRL